MLHLWAFGNTSLANLEKIPCDAMLRSSRLSVCRRIAKAKSQLAVPGCEMREQWQKWLTTNQAIEQRRIKAQRQSAARKPGGSQGAPTHHSGSAIRRND